MDYEKKYKEALNLARSYYDENANQFLDTLFPELKESEDERVRKCLCDIVNWLGFDSSFFLDNAVEKTSVLAYLEKQKEQEHICDSTQFEDGFKTGLEIGLRKQKEQKPNVEICPHFIKSKSYKENGYPIENCDYGLEIAYDILEKTLGKVRGYQTDDGLLEHQTAIEAVRKAKEQKPAEWSLSQLKMFDDILVAIKLGKAFTDKRVEELVNLLNTCRLRKYSIKPVEWSEEDEETRKDIIAGLEATKQMLYKADASGQACYNRWIDWLKSLRSQPKQEIYQAAKNDLAIKCINYLDENRPVDKMSLSNSECEDIVKAFKENDWEKIMRYAEKYWPHWKPSEKQMDALNEMILIGELSYVGQETTLVSLRDDLKRL